SSAPARPWSPSSATRASATSPRMHTSSRSLQGSVLIIGAGGLGCPAALALGAAGVRRIAVVDDDRVDPSNLHRQVRFGGAAVGTGGQLLTVPAGGRPCYRCLFEEPPPPGVGPSCAEAGVLGPVPGVIGALAGAEAALLLRGQAPAFVGRLLQYDSAGMTL